MRPRISTVAARLLIGRVLIGGVLIGGIVSLRPGWVDAGDPDGDGALRGAAAAGLSIRVLAPRVYPDVVYRLRLAGPAAAAERLYWSWEADGGDVLSDGATEIHWKSPDHPSTVAVRVREVGEGGDFTDHGAAIEIDVRGVSTENMVKVPAGVFVMGDSWDDPSHPHFVATFQNMPYKPPHRVYLDAYWIDRYRVTNAEYVEFLEASMELGLARVTESAVVGYHEGAEIPFYLFVVERPRSPIQLMPDLLRAISWDGKRLRIREGYEDHPVVDVTWSGARAYARFHGKRLPTEAEWEKAARGTGELRRFPWGDELPSPYHANINGYNGYQTVPVGSYSPAGDSPYGVSDMLGGFEWVEDWFGRFYYQDNYSSLVLRNPTGPEWGDDHPVRGVGSHYTFLGQEDLPPLAFRYQWVFEFGHGHLFGHNGTAFRTAMPAADGGEGGVDPAATRAGDTKTPLRTSGPYPVPESAPAPLPASQASSPSPASERGY